MHISYFTPLKRGAPRLGFRHASLPKVLTEQEYKAFLREKKKTLCFVVVLMALELLLAAVRKH